MLLLRVTHPFGDYAIGDEITDKAKISEYLANNHGSVVRVYAPDPAPEDTSAKKDG